MSRLEKWLDEEVSVIRNYYPDLMTPEVEEKYREELGRTLNAAQLRLADEADALATAIGNTGLGDRVLTALKEVSDRARDRGLREWFRRHW